MNPSKSPSGFSKERQPSSASSSSGPSNMSSITAISTDSKTENVVICHLCGNTIEGKFIHALNRTWHPEHFECVKCKSAILTPKFNQKEGMPYCDECYAQLFLKKCEVCHEPIRHKVIVAMDKTYHDNHFMCTVCRDVLGDVFFEKDSKPYCEACNVKLFAPECEGCHKPIIETAVVALDHKWHQDCFTCSKCRKPVREKTFQVDNNRPLCGICATVKLPSKISVLD